MQKSSETDYNSIQLGATCLNSAEEQSAERAACSTAVVGHQNKWKTRYVKRQIRCVQVFYRRTSSCRDGKAFDLQPTTVRIIRGKAEKINLCSQSLRGKD